MKGLYVDDAKFDHNSKISIYGRYLSEDGSTQGLRVKQAEIAITPEIIDRINGLVDIVITLE